MPVTRRHARTGQIGDGDTSGPEKPAARLRTLWSLRSGGAGDPADDADVDRVIEAFVAGDGHVLLVTGEHGPGPSRWAMRLLERARSVSDVVVAGHRADRSHVRVADGVPESAAAAVSLVRALARTRPGGPAAQWIARTTATTGKIASGPRLAHELSLVIVAEAARGPVTLLVEDIDRAGDGTFALIDNLRAVVDSVPLLVVVTATTCWGSRGPGDGRWRSWLGERAVLHVPVGPPARAVAPDAVLHATCGSAAEAPAQACSEGGQMDPAIRQELTELRASVAALEARQDVLIQALRHLSATIADMWGRPGPASAGELTAASAVGTGGEERDVAALFAAAVAPTAGAEAAATEAEVVAAGPERPAAVPHPVVTASVAPPGDAPQLTTREAEIMALAAVGCTNQEIADRLYLSVATVERQFTNLYRRLGVRNRAQALGILAKFGLPESLPVNAPPPARSSPAGAEAGPG